jgi:spore coat protein CotH
VYPKLYLNTESEASYSGSRRQSYELKEYDEQMVRRLIEKVTVFDEKMNIELKSGVEIDLYIMYLMVFY